MFTFFNDVFFQREMILILIFPTSKNLGKIWLVIPADNYSPEVSGLNAPILNSY